jgi:hypothetical protein
MCKANAGGARRKKRPAAYRATAVDPVLRVWGKATGYFSDYTERGRCAFPALPRLAGICGNVIAVSTATTDRQLAVKQGVFGSLCFVKSALAPLHCVHFSGVRAESTPAWLYAHTLGHPRRCVGRHGRGWLGQSRGRHESESERYGEFGNRAHSGLLENLNLHQAKSSSLMFRLIRAHGEPVRHDLLSRSCCS